MDGLVGLTRTRDTAGPSGTAPRFRHGRLAQRTRRTGRIASPPAITATMPTTKTTW